MLAAGWVRYSRSAAARTLPSSAICTNTSSWRGLMLFITRSYTNDQIFQVFLIDGGEDNGAHPRNVPSHEHTARRRPRPPHPAQPRTRPAARRRHRAARLMPLIGGPVIGILLGIAVRNLLSPDARFTPGIAFGGKQVLQWSIIALGFGLSLTQVAKTGLESLSVTLVTLTVAFLSAWALGRWLGVHDKLKILIGVGTAICGGSAIAAVTPIIKPDEHDTAFAISTIFLFNVVAVLLFPLLGHLLHLSDLGFGLWAGTAINDTSSVVAAGY